MAGNKVIVGTLLVATVLLAVLGCWFCWHCPSRIYPPEAHWFFWRQLAWNCTGLAVFAGVWLAGWKRLLKAAPWLMAAWLVAIAAAQFSRSVNGVHKWLILGPLRVNLAICFMPFLALFAAWLHEKKWIRPWMWWTGVLAAVFWVVWHVAGDGGRMERLAAFLNPRDWMQDRVYMSRQLLAAFSASQWFGDAGRSLGLLPCPESDGMMSAAALMFGKWFPAAIAGLSAVAGASMSLIWKGADDAPKRVFALLFGLWLVVPPAYCLLHSLALLPVAGMSPALAGYGGTAVVMAWFGVGALAAMSRTVKTDSAVAENDVPARRVCAAWCALAGVAILLVAFAPKRMFWTPGSDLMFAEPRPSDMEFGEFGLGAKRGRILAADGSTLAYTVRKWMFHVDPMAADIAVFNADTIRKIADGLGIPARTLIAAYIQTDAALGFDFICEAAEELGVSVDSMLGVGERRSSAPSARRYIYLKEVPDGGTEAKFFEENSRWLTRRCGIICEPVQSRIYPMGAATTVVTGFMHGGARTGKPCGAAGLEYALDDVLSGMDGTYDKSLRLNERYAKATPTAGDDVRTTIVPELQRNVSDALAAACATNGAESAWAIVMNASDGSIAAMASYPRFDQHARRLLDTEEKEWTMAINHAASDAFEPGGLVKPLTYSIAIDAGVLSNDAILTQEGGAWEYIVPERFHAALLRLGFGASTGVKGISGENAGIIASRPEYWMSDRTTAMRVGMGYGFAVTGLQIVQAYAMFANHGRIVKPHIIQSEGVFGAQAISPVAADSIAAMMSAPVCSTVQINEKGKYIPDAWIASCAGLHPIVNPRYVIAVSFRKPRLPYTGEEVAKPVWDRISGWLK